VAVAPEIKQLLQLDDEEARRNVEQLTFEAERARAGATTPVPNN